MKTLALPVRQHNASAQRIAEFLESHEAVERVWYPGKMLKNSAVGLSNPFDC